MLVTTLVLLHYLCSCQLLCQVYLCLDIQYADNIKNVCFYTQKEEKKILQNQRVPYFAGKEN